jgi:hypothetical protein
MATVLNDRVPVYRMLRAGSLRMFAYQFVRNFYVDYNKNKTVKENVDQFNRNQVASVKEGPLQTLGGVLDCLTADQCDRIAKDTTQPVRTDTHPSTGLNIDSATPHDRESKGVSDTVNDAYQEAVDEIPSADIKEGGFTDRMIANLVEKVVSAAAAKTVVAAIPYVGPIDILARLQHAVGTAFSKKLLTQTSVILKQQQYATIGAQWLGYSDQIKRGAMPLSLIGSLNPRLNNSETAASSKFLNNKDPSTGVPVDPKVGSNIDYTSDAVLDLIYGKLGLGLRLPLEIWYNTVSKVFNLIGDLGAEAIGWVTSITGVNAAFNAAMNSIFGENWQQELAIYAAKTLINLFGIDIDPLASGPQLANNIYTGVDVLNNRYVQQNAGGKELSPRETQAINAYLDREQRQYLSGLPLKERLFSKDNTNSLISKIIASVPASYAPAGILSGIMGLINNLPLAMLNLFDVGHSFALTAEDSANLNGQAQFGGTEAEIGMDIPENMAQDADPQCEPNSPDKFNNCQRYKDLIQDVAPCLYSNCPQFGSN